MTAPSAPPTSRPRRAAPWMALAIAGWLLAGLLVWRIQTQLAQLDDSVQTLQHRVMPLDLKRTMAWKQRYMDKVWHAAEAEDWQAAGWYLRQVQRLSEAVAEAGIDNSNGAISQFETAMLLPRFEPTFQALEASDRAAFLGRYRELVASCNACHAATRHAYVRIAEPTAAVSAWNQRFERSAPDPRIHRPDPLR